MISRLILLAGLIVAVLAGRPADAADARFSVQVRGSGPDVILIPGLASPRTVWDGLVPRLAGRYRLHLVQIGGFAGEPAGDNAQGPVLAPTAEALHRYIVEHRLGHPAIIGHSLGGLLGLMLASAHPEDVGRLMVVDSFPFIGAAYDPAATVEQARPQAAALRDGVIAQSQAAFADSEQAAVQRFSIKPETRQRILAWALASDRSVLARATYDDLTTDVRPDLTRIKAPVMVLYPYDPSMGASAEQVGVLYQRAYAGLPQAQIVRIEGAYHFLMLDQPDAFARQVEIFLQK